MAPAGLAVIIGAGPTSGAGVARVLADPQKGNLAVALLARNEERLERLASDLRQSSNGGVLHPFATDTQPDNLHKTFQQIVAHADFQGLKLKLSIYHVKNATRRPFLEETPEAFNDSMQTYTTGAVVFAQESIKLMYSQNGGQTLLPDTNGTVKGTIIFTGTLGAMRTNQNYASYGASRAAARMVAQAIAKEHSKYGVHVVHTIANGPIIDGENERTRAGISMRAEDVGETYLWLSRQPCGCMRWICDPLRRISNGHNELDALTGFYSTISCILLPIFVWLWACFYHLHGRTATELLLHTACIF